MGAPEIAAEISRLIAQSPQGQELSPSLSRGREEARNIEQLSAPVERESLVEPDRLRASELILGGISNAFSAHASALTPNVDFVDSLAEIVADKQAEADRENLFNDRTFSDARDQRQTDLRRAERGQDQARQDTDRISRRQIRQGEVMRAEERDDRDRRDRLAQQDKVNTRQNRIISNQEADTAADTARSEASILETKAREERQKFSRASALGAVHGVNARDFNDIATREDEQAFNNAVGEQIKAEKVKARELKDSRLAQSKTDQTIDELEETLRTMRAALKATEDPEQLAQNIADTRAEFARMKGRPLVEEGLDHINNLMAEAEQIMVEFEQVEEDQELGRPSLISDMFNELSGGLLGRDRQTFDTDEKAEKARILQELIEDLERSAPRRLGL